MTDAKAKLRNDCENISEWTLHEKNPILGFKTTDFNIHFELSVV